MIGLRSEERIGAARRLARPGTVILRNRKREWCAAVLLYVIFFLIMLEYHRWRQKPYSFFTANKAMAIASSLLFCLALSLGPLHRLTGRLAGTLRLRRCIALSAVVLLVPHLVLSLCIVEKFDWDYYLEKWLSWVFAAAALAGFVRLSLASFERGFRRLGKERWASLQEWAPLFLGLIVIHIVFLGKVPEWVHWCRTINFPVPPGTTVPSTAIILTLGLRVVDRIVLSRRGEGK